MSYVHKQIFKKKKNNRRESTNKDQSEKNDKIPHYDHFRNFNNLLIPANHLRVEALLRKSCLFFCNN